VRYLDSSVVLAELFVEKRRPPEALWSDSLVSSRLLVYEVWAKLHARGLGEALGEQARALLGGLALLEMEPSVLARALEPFPRPVRALDAMHLATADFLRRRGADVSVATYDARLSEAASEMGFELYRLEEHHSSR